MEADVPRGPEQIDAAWLETVLAADPRLGGVPIRAVRWSRIGVGYGLDGQVARLELSLAGGHTDSLVAKFAAAKPGRTEASFYEHVAPRVPGRLATFHGARVCEDGDRAVLLLEDLTPAAQGDAVRGGTSAEAAEVMRAMARFHAAFAGGGVSPADVLPRWEPNTRRALDRLAERNDRFRDRYGRRLDARVLAIVADLPRTFPEAVAVLEAEAPTLVHGDLHLDNVLFLPSGEAVVLDWAHARRGPAALDVVRLFVEGIRAETRRAHEPALLGAYREAGGALRADAPALGAAVRWHLAYAVMWAGAADPGFERPRVRAIVDSLVRNTAAAAFDHLG